MEITKAELLQLYNDCKAYVDDLVVAKDSLLYELALQITPTMLMPSCEQYYELLEVAEAKLAGLFLEEISPDNVNSALLEQACIIWQEWEEHRELPIVPTNTQLFMQARAMFGVVNPYTLAEVARRASSIIAEEYLHAK